MSELLEKIRGGGHWRVVIRPTDFQTDRIEFGELEPFIQARQVRIRGWYFPHIDVGTPIVNGEDWIGQESDSGAYVEAWRYFTSGQFVWFRSFKKEPIPHEDGLHSSCKSLYVNTVINVSTEAFELAARMALADSIGSGVFLRVSAGGIKDYRLVVGDWRRAELDHVPANIENEISWKGTFGRSDLIANPRMHALDSAVWLLQRLGWRSAPRGIVHEMQKEIFGAGPDF